MARCLMHPDCHCAPESLERRTGNLHPRESGKSGMRSYVPSHLQFSFQSTSTAKRGGFHSPYARSGYDTRN
jgi:hypothetical protein